MDGGAFLDAAEVLHSQEKLNIIEMFERANRTYNNISVSNRSGFQAPTVTGDIIELRDSQLQGLGYFSKTDTPEERASIIDDSEIRFPVSKRVSPYNPVSLRSYNGCVRGSMSAIFWNRLFKKNTLKLLADKAASARSPQDRNDIESLFKSENVDFHLSILSDDRMNLVKRHIGKDASSRGYPMYCAEFAQWTLNRLYEQSRKSSDISATTWNLVLECAASEVVDNVASTRLLPLLKEANVKSVTEHVYLDEETEAKYRGVIEDVRKTVSDLFKRLPDKTTKSMFEKANARLFVFARAMEWAIVLAKIWKSISKALNLDHEYINGVLESKYGLFDRFTELITEALKVMKFGAFARCIKDSLPTQAPNWVPVDARVLFPSFSYDSLEIVFSICNQLAVVKTWTIPDTKQARISISKNAIDEARRYNEFMAHFLERNHAIVTNNIEESSHAGKHPEYYRVFQRRPIDCEYRVVELAGHQAASRLLVDLKLDPRDETVAFAYVELMIRFVAALSLVGLMYLILQNVTLTSKLSGILYKVYNRVFTDDTTETIYAFVRKTGHRAGPSMLSIPLFYSPYMDISVLDISPEKVYSEFLLDETEGESETRYLSIVDPRVSNDMLVTELRDDDDDDDDEDDESLMSTSVLTRDSTITKNQLFKSIPYESVVDQYTCHSKINIGRWFNDNYSQLHKRHCVFDANGNITIVRPFKKNEEVTVDYGDAFWDNKRAHDLQLRTNLPAVVERALFSERGVSHDKQREEDPSGPESVLPELQELPGFMTDSSEPIPSARLDYVDRHYSLPFQTKKCIDLYGTNVNKCNPEIVKKAEEAYQRYKDIVWNDRKGHLMTLSQMWEKIRNGMTPGAVGESLYDTVVHHGLKQIHFSAHDAIRNILWLNRLPHNDQETQKYASLAVSMVVDAIAFAYHGRKSLIEFTHFYKGSLPSVSLAHYATSIFPVTIRPVLQFVEEEHSIPLSQIKSLSSAAMEYLFAPKTGVMWMEGIHTQKMSRLVRGQLYPSGVSGHEEYESTPGTQRIVYMQDSVDFSGAEVDDIYISNNPDQHRHVPVNYTEKVVSITFKDSKGESVVVTLYVFYIRGNSNHVSAMEHIEGIGLSGLGHA